MGDQDTGDKYDFFVSYTAADENWATWIAECLEQEGYSTFVQAWNILPGHNFWVEMERGLDAAERVVWVLSPRSLRSNFVTSERASAQVSDPTGAKRGLIPVRIESCKLPRLSKPVVYIDLVDVEEGEARHRIMNGVSKDGPERRSKGFPGTSTSTEETKTPYPGARPSESDPPDDSRRTDSSHESTESPYVDAARIVLTQSLIEDDIARLDLMKPWRVVPTDDIESDAEKLALAILESTPSDFLDRLHRSRRDLLDVDSVATIDDVFELVLPILVAGVPDFSLSPEGGLFAFSGASRSICELALANDERRGSAFGPTEDRGERLGEMLVPFPPTSSATGALETSDFLRDAAKFFAVPTDPFDTKSIANGINEEMRLRIAADEVSGRRYYLLLPPTCHRIAERIVAVGKQSDAKQWEHLRVVKMMASSVSAIESAVRQRLQRYLRLRDETSSTKPS